MFNQDILNKEEYVLAQLKNCENIISDRWITTFETLFISLKNFLILDKTVKLLKEDNIEIDFFYSIDGGYTYIKELYKIQLFALTNFVKSFEEFGYDETIEMTGNISPVLNELKEYYSSLEHDIILDKKEIKKIYFEKSFDILSRTSYLSFELLTDIRFFDKKDFNKFFGLPLNYSLFLSKILSNFYIAISDKAIQYLTHREKDLVMTYGKVIPREKPTSFWSLTWITKKYNLLVEKYIIK